MTGFQRGLTVLLVLSCVVFLSEAWNSPQADRTGERREFLQNAASSVTVGATAVVTVSASTSSGPAAARAAGDEPTVGKGRPGETIYTPSPGSLAGQVHVVTGASTGLGLESAKRLAAGGAAVVCTARTAVKGEKAAREVREYLRQNSVQNPPEVYFVTLDLDDLESVRTFPDRYERAIGGPRKIDVLVNNAGVAAIPQREFTKDGFERTFQSNHLGPFVLTAVLFPYLNRSGSRVINVSSTAHNFAGSGKEHGLNMGNLNGELEYSFDGWEAYGFSKLENILFAQELQRRADDAGLGWLTVNSMHPGVVGTDIWRNTYVGTKAAADGTKNKRFSPQGLASKLFYGSTLSVEEGANTQVWLAAAPSGSPIRKGAYYDENRRLGNLQAFARDEEKAKELWGISEKLSGTTFKVL